MYSVVDLSRIYTFRDTLCFRVGCLIREMFSQEGRQLKSRSPCFLFRRFPGWGSNSSVVFVAWLSTEAWSSSYFGFVGYVFIQMDDFWTCSWFPIASGLLEYPLREDVECPLLARERKLYHFKSCCKSGFPVRVGCVLLRLFRCFCCQECFSGWLVCVGGLVRTLCVTLRPLICLMSFCKERFYGCGQVCFRGHSL